MNYYDFISLMDNAISVLLNSKAFIYIAITTIILIIIIIIAFNKKYLNKFEIQEMTILNINLVVNKKNVNAAHKILSQLSTRKIGMIIEDDDVIVEIYDSWYESFKAIRELLIEVKPCTENSRLILLANNVLNQGMRPHLTKWQAKFRRWYSRELEKVENENLSPQEIQKKYPLYNELVEDLEESQKVVLYLKAELERVFN